MAANLPYTNELQALYKHLQEVRNIVGPLSIGSLFSSSIEQTTGLGFLTNYFMKTVFCDEEKVAANIQSIKEHLNKIIAAVLNMSVSETLNRDYVTGYNTLRKSTESLMNDLSSIITELDKANLKQAKETLSPIVDSMEKTIRVDIPALLYGIAQEFMEPNRALKDNFPIAEEVRMSFIYEFHQVLNENPRYEQAYTLQQQVVVAAANQAIFNP
jgi:hypothetical protein